jgi:DNA-binding transcriptional ArsR family regulator
MPTQRKIILFLLKKEIATSIEIRNFVKKSPSVISVNLKELYKAKIINKRYDIPSNKFSLKNPKEIEGMLNEYYPMMVDKFVENTIEMLDF